MDVIVEAVILAAIQLLIFYDLGFVLPVTRADEAASTAETVLSGFLLYTVVFEVIALFSTWLCIPQQIFFYLWGVTLAFGVVGSFVWNFGKWVRRCRAFWRNLKPQPLVPLVWIFVLGECAFAATRLSGSMGTVAQMTTDLATNSMSLYAPATGELVTSISTSSLLARWQLSGEFFCALLGLHPAAYAHITGSIVTVVLSSMVVYRLGVRLFDGSRVSASILSLLVILANFFFTTAYTASGILLRAAFTSDAMLANVILPLFLLLAIAIYEEDEWKHLLFLVFCAGTAGFCISEAAFFIIPFAVLACILPAVLLAKKWVGMFWVMLLALLMTAGSLFVYFIPVIPFG